MPQGNTRVTVRGRRRRWRTAVQVLLPFLFAALLGGGAWAYGNSQPPAFTSEALVAVLPTDPENPISTGATALWVQIGNSDQLRLEAGQRIGVPPEELEDAVTVAQAGDAALVSIEVTTGSGAQSAAWANGMAEALQERGDRNFVAGYILRQVTSGLPGQPTEGFGAPLVAAASVVGLLIGLAVARAWAKRSRRVAAAG